MKWYGVIRIPKTWNVHSNQIVYTAMEYSAPDALILCGNRVAYSKEEAEQLMRALTMWVDFHYEVLEVEV